jgi:hypothetical protein
MLAGPWNVRIPSSDPMPRPDVLAPVAKRRQIAEAFGCRTKTVENIRQRLVERGFEETRSAASTGK